MAVNLHLHAWRFGYDDGTESTHSFVANENEEAVLQPDTNYLLRLGIQQVEATAAANLAQQFRYNLNDAGWVNITTSSSAVQAITPVSFANNAASTTRLTTLTGNPDTSNANCTTDGSSGGTANDVPASGHSETVLAFRIIGTAVAHGDHLKFDCTISGPTTTLTADVTPIAEVSKPFSYVGVGKSANSTDLDIVYTATAGNLLVAVVKWEGSSGGTGITSLSDGTQNFTIKTLTNNGTDMHAQMAYLLSATGGSQTYTIAINGTEAWVAWEILEFATGEATAALDVEATAGTGNSANLLTAAFTLSGATSGVVVGFGSSYTGSNTFTAPRVGGTGVLAVPCWDYATALLKFTNTGTAITAGTSTTSGLWICQALAFKAESESSSTPSSTASSTKSSTPSTTVSSTVSTTPSETPSSTVSSTPSSTVSATVSMTPSSTVSETPSPSSTPSTTISSTQSSTVSSTPSGTPSSTSSSTVSSTPSPSSTPSTTVSSTSSSTASATQSATPSSTESATQSATASATSSNTPSSTQSATASATVSATPSSTVSATPSATVSTTVSETPSATTSATASATVSATPSSTMSATASATPSATAAATSPSNTPSSTVSSTPSATSSATASATPSSSSEALVGGIIKVFDGAAWNVRAMKRYTGVAWVPVTGEIL